MPDQHDDRAFPNHDAIPTTDPEMRRPLSRLQVIRWRETWSWSDKDTIERHLDRVKATSFYTPPSGAYIRCLDEAGRSVMFIGPGWVEFPERLATEECDPNWHGFALSTFRAHGRASRAAEGSGRFCPTHQIELSNTGACGFCD